MVIIKTIKDYSKKVVGVSIKIVLFLTGVSKSYLADLSNVSKSLITHITNGVKYPNGDLMNKFYQLTGVFPEEFFDIMDYCKGQFDLYDDYVAFTMTARYVCDVILSNNYINDEISNYCDDDNVSVKAK